jgi:Zn-finger nucleic acid-binding protein
MNCPNCSAEMSEEKRGGVRLDLCGVCFGVWFDGGELEEFQAGSGSVWLSGVPDKGTRFEPTGDSAHVRCPRCEGDILRTGKVSKYEVLRCTTCRGLFLPLSDPRYNTSKRNGILDSAIGALESIVGALF